MSKPTNNPDPGASPPDDSHRGAPTHPAPPDPDTREWKQGIQPIEPWPRPAIPDTEEGPPRSF